jgi:ABC-type polar amino acid transport system ATPase subunit
VAEGLRKIATLVHLINNGSLAENGILLWDEPEANLNPQLVSKVSDLLVELALQGVQVILTTHDYLLPHKLSLVSEYLTHDIETKFFGFYRRNRRDPVEIDEGKILSELAHNPILEEFANHHQFERKLFYDGAKE